MQVLHDVCISSGPAIQNWSKKQKEGSDLSNILTALGSGKRYTVGWPAAAE